MRFFFNNTRRSLLNPYQKEPLQSPNSNEGVLPGTFMMIEGVTKNGHHIQQHIKHPTVV